MGPSLSVDSLARGFAARTLMALARDAKPPMPSFTTPLPSRCAVVWSLRLCAREPGHASQVRDFRWRGAVALMAHSIWEPIIAGC